MPLPSFPARRQSSNRTPSSHEECASAVTRAGRARRAPRRLHAAAAALVAACALVAGCSILRAAPDQSRYFVLSSTTAADATPSRGRADIRFGLGPVKLPGYLDAQALVRSGPDGVLEYVPHAFWAEPVREGFARALLHRTAARVGTSQALAYPWYSTAKLDWKVPVDVLRFEATTDGRAVLVARWGIEPLAGGAPSSSTETTCDEQAGSDPGLVVDALSRCVDRLADAIAAGLAARPSSSASPPAAPKP